MKTKKARKPARHQRRPVSMSKAAQWTQDQVRGLGLSLFEIGETWGTWDFFGADGERVLSYSSRTGFYRTVNDHGRCRRGELLRLLHRLVAARAEHRGTAADLATAHTGGDHHG